MSWLAGIAASIAEKLLTWLGGLIVSAIEKWEAQAAAKAAIEKKNQEILDATTKAQTEKEREDAAKNVISDV